MSTNKDQDRLASVEQTGFTPDWDWKSKYVSTLAEDGYERFSQFSASPDSTAIFAGPARFSGLANAAQDLLPIGLTDGINISANPMLQRLYEIGSNRAFFTRGKTMHSLQLGKMLADQQNILAALTKNAYRPSMATGGTAGPGAETPNPNIMMNLDSEYFSVPFGVLLVFKTRGGPGSGSESNGKILTACYLEYCMFSNYGFSISSGAPVITEGVGIEFDRVVPVSFAN